MPRSRTTIGCLTVIVLLMIAWYSKGARNGPPKRPAAAGIRPVSKLPADHERGGMVGRVVSVHDGDTITILTPSHEQVKIRLHGIDAPESGMPYGQASKRALSNMVFGREVVLESYGTDRYGRCIGEVFVDGADINRQMIRSGYAWHYRQYDHTRDLQDDEDGARVARRGLWQEPDPEPPWEYRHHEHPRAREAHPSQRRHHSSGTQRAR
jgi:endonuclease YncB( thermonuclease family)